MTTRIATPGIYDMPAEDYHADPCPLPSLSSSGARTIVNECPAVFWHQRQNREPKRVFEIGTAGHLMALEPQLFDAKVHVIAADDYRTKAAREQRDAARAAGITPLLEHEAQMVRDMRAVLWADPIASKAFEGGLTEQTLIHKDREFGIWRRARPDYMPPHRRYLVDYKTSTTADPEAFSKAMLNYGYHMQAAWLIDACEALYGERPEKFCFVVQSKQPPHLVSVCWVDPEAIAIGATLNRYACGLFRWCLDHDQWPGFRDDITAPQRAFTVSLPGFAIKQFEAALDAGRYTPPEIAA
jgi:hypothetical protein